MPQHRKNGEHAVQAEYAEFPIEIRRSSRRRKTVAARWEGHTAVVMMPAGLPADEEQRLLDDILGKLQRSHRRGQPSITRSDAELLERSLELSRRWLDGRARPASVRWVGPMRSRWASCSQHSGNIRVSQTLNTVPDYVLDYVLFHELVHLIVPGGHPPEFWELARRYPRAERAMGYLQAFARPPADPGPDTADDPSDDSHTAEGPGDLLDGL